MLLVFLPFLSVAKTFITNIHIDGHPLQGFISNKYDYFVRIPYEKKYVKIYAYSSNVNKQAKIMWNNLEVALNTTLPLISLEEHSSYQVKAGKRIYTLRFVRVSPITETISINTNKRLSPRTNTNEENAPQINSARIVSSLPMAAFTHYISTTGDKPIKFTATGLPTTLKLYENEGIINGTAPDSGTFPIKITATNAYGADQIVLKIVICSHQRLTPIMGWSSWYTQSHAISEDGVRKMAESAVKFRIHDYGFTYLNIDDCWHGPRSDVAPYPPTGKKPFNKDGVQYGGFNDFKALTDYIHSLGLKAGIYQGPKPSTYAGFLGSSSYNLSGMDYNNFSPNNGNDNSRGPDYDESGTGSGSGGKPGVYQPSQFYGSWFYGYEESVGAKAIGPYWFGNVDIQQFADWGFDFMKWDWLLYKNTTLTEELTLSLNTASSNSGRSMALSLSNNVGHNRDLTANVKKNGATMARISTDIYDQWGSIKSAVENAFELIDFGGDGFWPDPDMIQIGYLGNASGLNIDYHLTHLTEAEQYFQVSFWAIYPAPMILSCDLSQLEDFALGLLQNREMVLINQDSLGIPSIDLKKESKVIVRRLDDGTIAVGTFNMEDKSRDIEVSLADVEEAVDIGLPKGATLRSVWEQKDIGIVDDKFTVKLEAHQGLLFKLIPVE